MFVSMLYLVATILAALNPLRTDLGKVLGTPLRGDALGPCGVVEVDELAPRLLIVEVNPAEGNLKTKSKRSLSPEPKSIRAPADVTHALATAKQPFRAVLAYLQNGTGLLVHNLLDNLLAVGEALAELGDVTEVFGLVLRQGRFCV